jgi:hypothetical protein
MLEKTLEYKLRDKIKALDGLCLKWQCPGWTGVPDRIVLMPGGRIYFVELKNGNKGVLSPRQVVVHKVLLKLGFQVWVITNNEEINEFIESINSL